MGNFHCIPSDCATVHWREYLPPSVRYRYSPDDEWTYINNANNYSIEPEIAQCNTTYNVVGTYENGNQNYGNPGELRQFYVSFRGNFRALENNNQLQISYIFNQRVRRVTCRDLKLGSQISITDDFITNPNVTVVYGMAETAFINSITRADGLPDDCGNCVFKVYLDDSIVYEEERQECPEVEIIPCRLSEINNAIKIDKLPYLERIEVVPYSYRNFAGSVFQGIIPDECLIIYQNLTTTIVPQFKEFPTPLTNASEATYGFIKQICSAPGCPPPEYTVVCDCDCESCPDGTCATDCGDHICCYDTSTGKAVQQIDKSNYCGDNS